jgi:hypothetical protein
MECTTHMREVLVLVLESPPQDKDHIRLYIRSTLFVATKDNEVNIHDMKP